MRHVILTNTAGEDLATTTAADAHQGVGLLHKAFSAFVFRNSGREVLIQKRAAGKRFGNLWANTCCSHPQEGESIEESGRTRMAEEWNGLSVPLTVAGSFTYQAHDPQTNEAEHEYDTVLVGSLAQEVELDPDPEEIAEWKWVEVSKLQRDMEAHPEKYAPWLPPALKIALARQV